jgi:hypothetical protein
VRDDVELPHNNLDFLLLLRRGDPAREKERLDPLLQEIARAHGLGVDLGVLRAESLARSPCLVMWYDMRHGHKTIVGDDRFVPSLSQFVVDRIVPSDVRNLLTNRGTLLVINELLLEKPALSEDEKKLLVKHAVKAIIGYGDALLFFLGAYHWSYAEKQRRMRHRGGVDEAFRALYDEALGFRFRPSYARYLGRDLPGWTAELSAQLSRVHREVESRRLGAPVRDWSGYLEAALARAVVEDLPSPRAVAKKFRNTVSRWGDAGSARDIMCGAPCVPGLSLGARVGMRFAGPKGTLPLALPAVLYRDVPSAVRAQVGGMLGARSSDPRALRRRYLLRWSRLGDPNFASVARRHDIHLDPDDVHA